jgi:hypothetical protein
MQALLRRTLQSGARLGPRAAAAAGAGAVGVAALGTSTSLDAPPSALSPAEFRAFKVTKIERISHNTALYRCAAGLRRGLQRLPGAVPHGSAARRFALPDPNQTVGLPVASCMVTRCAACGGRAGARGAAERLRSGCGADAAARAAAPTSARAASPWCGRTRRCLTRTRRGTSTWWSRRAAAAAQPRSCGPTLTES